MLTRDIYSKDDTRQRVSVTYGLSQEALDEGMVEVRRRLEDGFDFEGSEASLCLVLRRAARVHEPLFELVRYSYMKTVHASHPAEDVNDVVILMKINGRLVHAIGSSDHGPIDAMDKALRSALTDFYPSIKTVSLKDYQVHDISPGDKTAAKVRVDILSADNGSSWGTQGVDTDVIAASFAALVDSFEYKVRVFDEQNQSCTGLVRKCLTRAWRKCRGVWQKVLTLRARRRFFVWC